MIVADLPSCGVTFLSDSQDVVAVRDYGYDADHEFDSYIIVEGKIYGMKGIIPTMNKEITELGAWED
jgi:hypothetical protein